MYDQLVAHEIPWTDQSVKDALTFMADIVGDSDNMAGGTEEALQTEMPDSVGKVFTDSPEAAMVVIGDFAPGVVETTLEPESGYNVFTFPSVEDSGPSVVGGGDLFVEFKDSPAADAFLEYLTTPDAAEIWAERGGFSSPNKNLDTSVYPDEITQTTAGALAEAEDLPLRPLRPRAVGVRWYARSRVCSRRSRTSSRTRTTSTGSRSRWRPTPRRRTAARSTRLE